MGYDDLDGSVLVYDWRIPSNFTGVRMPPLVEVFPGAAIVLAISPDGATLFAGDNISEQVVALDTATLTLAAATLNAAGRPRGLAVGPTGRFLYVAVDHSTTAPNSLNIFDLTGVLPNQSIPLAGAPAHVAVTPNNSYLVVTRSAPMFRAVATWRFRQIAIDATGSPA